MSADRTLILDCPKFNYIGSSGESEFGSPVSVEKNPEISEWVQGLRQDGGAGYLVSPLCDRALVTSNRNVLRDRKQEREGTTIKAPIPRSEATKPVTSKPKRVVVKPPGVGANADPQRAYEKSWAVRSFFPTFSGTIGNTRPGYYS